MGREIRMVPPNWDHPKDERGQLQSMFNSSFAQVAAEWKANFARWESGERPDYADEDDRKLEYWEWEGPPPDRDSYRPWNDEDATWFQLWETVSEGTPITPPFPTKEALADHLAKHGTYWDNTPWGYAKAAAMVNAGYAPSMILTGGAIIMGEDVPLAMEQSK